MEVEVQGLVEKNGKLYAVIDYIEIDRLTINNRKKPSEMYITIGSVDVPLYYSNPESVFMVLQ